MIPDKPIPIYPQPQDESDWQKLLKYSKAMIERLQSSYGLPESDDQLQAVVHLFQTLAPGHYRRLH